jgi:hypothetical protein
VHTGRRLYTDSARSDRAVPGSVHACVHHTQHESVRGDVHETRAECLVSLRKVYLRVLRGLSKYNLPGSVGFLEGLRTFWAPACVRAGRDALVGSLKPIWCDQNQKGRVCQMLRSF